MQNRVRCGAVICAVAVVWGSACGASGQRGELPFRQVGLPLDRRVDDLVGRMTTEEKIGELMMNSPAIPRLDIPAYHWWSEGLHGIARDGVATVFPQAIGLAATWDPVLHQRVAEVISTEARAKNNAAMAKHGGGSGLYEGLTIWSPNINIFRDPRWGRGQETYGEDPFLTARFGVAFVKGMQGDDPAYLRTVATLKHFAVHSGPEEARHRFDAVISDRDLHETYLPAFEAGVREGGAKSLMSAYNAIDGVPAPANKYLLTTMLRDTWGFSGAVVGDVDTVADIYKPQAHGYARDAAEASADALKAGNDLCSGTTYQALGEALKRRLVTEEDINRAVRRVMRVRFELGQFDPAEAVPYRAIPASAVGSADHAALALKAAEESVVLLKNDGTLPWDVKSMKTLAVVGPTADDSAALLGNYNGTPEKPVTILQGLRAKLEPLGVKVMHAPEIPLVEGFNMSGEALPPGMLFTDATKQAAGLKREVFNSDAFTGQPVSTGTDTALDLHWNAAEPVAGLPVSGVNVRWTGVLVSPVAVNTKLSLKFGGAASLYLDDKFVLGEAKPGDPGASRLRSGDVHLEAGRAYRIRVEYRQRAMDTTGLLHLGWMPPVVDDAGWEALQKADHILLTLGISPELEGEESALVIDGFSHGDRTSIQLPKVQRDLIARVAGLGKPFTVVLTGSASLVFDVSKPNAILMAWYYGQSGGDAVADILLGRVNPSGHLPVTFYASDADLPAFTDYSMANRTYRYFTGKALYPFGFGQSYTTFDFQNVTLSNKRVREGDTVQVRVTVKNSGKVPGDTVVQIYAHAVHPPVPMPLEALVGFARVSLRAGESKQVSVPLRVRDMRRWNDQTKNYVVDPGDYELRIGQSSGAPLQRAMLTVRQ